MNSGKRYQDNNRQFWRKKRKKSVLPGTSTIQIFISVYVIFFRGLLWNFIRNLSFVGGTINRVLVSKKLLEIHFNWSDNVWLVPSPKASFFPTAYVFRVTWSTRSFGRPFVSHTSAKFIDREGLERRRTGTGQKWRHFGTVGPSNLGLVY